MVYHFLLQLLSMIYLCLLYNTYLWSRDCVVSGDGDAVGRLVSWREQEITEDRSHCHTVWQAGTGPLQCCCYYVVVQPKWNARTGNAATGLENSWQFSVVIVMFLPPGPRCKSKTGRQNQDRSRLSTNHRRRWRDLSRPVLHYNAPLEMWLLIRLVTSVCLSVCLSCLCSNFWKRWPRNFMVDIQIHLTEYLLQVHMSRSLVEVKVTEVKWRN